MLRGQLPCYGSAKVERLSSNIKAVGSNPNLGSEAFPDEDLHKETIVEVYVTHIKSIVLGSIILELLARLSLDLIVLSIIRHELILDLFNFCLLAFG